MLANANPHQSVPASRNAREFVAVCARHNVAYGDLNCLPTLLRELKVNKHFAMHFWSVVAGMVDKQSAEPQTVLAAIVDAVTGRTLAEVREAGPAQRILLDRLERLLAGLDVEPEAAPETEQAAAVTPVERAATERTAADSGPVSEDVLPIRRAPHGKRRRAGRRRGLEHEPIAPVTNPAWTRDESLRLVLVPEPPVTENAAPSAGEPLLSRGIRPELSAKARPVPVPLSGYAEEQPRRSVSAGAVVLVLVIAAVAGGGYLFLRDGGMDALDRLGISIRAGYDSAMAAWKGERQATSSTAAQNPPAEAAPAPVQAAPAAATAPASPAPSATIQPNSQTPPAQSSAQKARPAGLTPEQSMAAAAAYNQQREAAGLSPAIPPAADATTTGAGGLVQVPEAAMNAHLIASRVPVIPDDARENGVTGVVRMQATINRNGFVQRLHVLQGPTLLRPAALAAVSAWRYRPYLVNGQPVDVMTTITVDFSSLE